MVRTGDEHFKMIPWKKRVGLIRKPSVYNQHLPMRMSIWDC